MFYISKGNIVKWCIIVLCVVIAVLWLSDHNRAASQISTAGKYNMNSSLKT